MLTPLVAGAANWGLTLPAVLAALLAACLSAGLTMAVQSVRNFRIRARNAVQLRDLWEVAS